MSKAVFGIDIGGTSLKCGLFSTEGVMLRKDELPTRTEESGKYIFDDIADYIFRVINEEKMSPEDIAGIGLGVPGSVNKAGIVNKCVNLGWGVTDASKCLAEKINQKNIKGCEYLGTVIRVGNDANMAALGEYWQGSGKGYESFMFVGIGTGVGGGLIMDGKAVNGFNGAAAELGHLPIASDIVTQKCNCGKTGCLEQVASATGIARLAGMNNAKEVFEAAKAGNEAAVKAVDTAAFYLAKGLACVAAVADPEVFIIGGGVSAAGSYFTDRIESFYRQQVFHPSKDTKVITARLGNDAGMYGAAKLAL